jgi:hypothetical protein
LAEIEAFADFIFGAARYMKKPDYGLDAPGLVRGFLFGGPALFAAGYFLVEWAKPRGFGPLIGMGYTAFYTGIILFLESFLLMASSY